MITPGFVIFDLDGTLLDTVASLAGAYNSALTDMNCPTHPVDAFRTFVGDGARNAAIRCLPPDRQDEESISRCLQGFEHNYSGAWQTATIYPGITDCLDALRAQVPLGVLSNKDDAFTQQCISYFFPGVFSDIRGFTSDFAHKPDPKLALQMIDKAGVSSAETWIIGDTATDMNTAAACKAQAVGVLWGFRDRDELLRAGADVLISAPSELIDLYSEAS